MYVFLSILIIVIIINYLCTTVLTSSSNNRILHNLKQIVNTALEQDTSDDINNDLLIEQLSQILEQEEGFRIADRKQRSVYSTDAVFDGSGDLLEDENLPPFYSNMSIITFTLGTTTTAFSKYTPYAYPPCQCDKGERGDKGDAGICPTDCGWRYQAERRDCIGSQVNLDRLAQSIRQLIIDTKKIAYRNARAMPCTCPTLPIATTPSLVSNQMTLDYNTYVRLKGDKGDRGDTGTSCSPSCQQSAQTNIRVFKTLQEATDASITYPDHTYVHIVNDYGRLQGVLIRVNGQLIPLRLEDENSLIVQPQTLPPASLSIPKPACGITLPCPSLHMFALGPHVRKMCHSKREATQCSKLSDYDDICGRVSGRQRLQGFYRAFMSTSTQWLSNIFAGICVSAKIVNMHEQTLFDSVEDMFEQKVPQSEILDVQGFRPQFQYWWHGTFVNGTASSDTCLDWSRQDSNLSGIASRLPDGINGLFYHQYTWPCSIVDSNMGILCIETNCNRNTYYKH